MKPIKDMNQAELAAYVQNHLKSREIDVVLSGGAVVGIYSKGDYVSNDIDLINIQFADRHKITSAMEEIGFKSVGQHFQHPDTLHYIEFPPGPLSLGQEKVIELNEISLESGILRALTPTDCVKDRLSHYFHWGDRQCLAQAKLVAANYKVDFESIRDWSHREGKGAAIEAFFDDL